MRRQRTLEGSYSGTASSLMELIPVAALEGSSEVVGEGAAMLDDAK